MEVKQTHITIEKDKIEQVIQWAEKHGEIVFAGGGMDAVDSMNVFVESLRRSVAKAEMQESVMVNISPPATQRNRWMYEQGRLAERDPRTHADIAWELAEKVRRDLDRQSCPGVYMNLAMESIVKYYTHQQPKREPLTDWVSVDDRLPDDGGYYLVTVATDDEPHVDVLLFDAKRKHWEHEGGPTFCHSYYFEPTHWAVRPEAANAIKG